MGVLRALIELVVSPAVGALVGFLLGLLRFAYVLAETLFGWDKDVDVTDQVIIVTGAAGGFGVAVTRRLLAKGAVVWGVDVVDEDAAWKALEMKKGGDAQGKKYNYRQVDLTDNAAMKKFVDELRAQKVNVYAVLNNAGIAIPTSACETTPATLNKVMGVNFAAACELPRLLFDQQSSNCLFKCGPRRCTAGAPPTRSRIVNVTSIAGVVTSSGMSTYTASKHALEAWSDATRLEMQDKYLDVSIIEPFFATSGIYRVLLNPGFDPNKEGSILAEQSAKAAAKFKNALAKPGALMTSDFVAAVIVKALCAARPQDRYMVTPNEIVHMLMRVVMHCPNYFSVVDKLKAASSNRDTI